MSNENIKFLNNLPDYESYFVAHQIQDLIINQSIN